MNFDDLAKFGLALPPFLTTEARLSLLEQLGRYPSSSGFFGLVSGDDPVQGDGMRGFPIFELNAVGSRTILGLIISNSCDLASENNPTPDQRVVYAPILNLDIYRERLIGRGYLSKDADGIINQIRRQEVVRLFYLPAVPGQFGESVIALDNLYSLPLGMLNEERRTRVFSLSNFGWYVLLFKLSVHFTRMTDAVRRESLAGI